MIRRDTSEWEGKIFGPELTQYFILKRRRIAAELGVDYIQCLTAEIDPYRYGRKLLRRLLAEGKDVRELAAEMYPPRHLNRVYTQLLKEVQA